MARPLPGAVHRSAFSYENRGPQRFSKPLHGPLTRRMCALDCLRRHAYGYYPLVDNKNLYVDTCNRQHARRGLEGEGQTTIGGLRANNSVSYFREAIPRQALSPGRIRLG